MHAVGVDGCPGGWIAVARDASGGLDSRVFESVDDLLRVEPSPGIVCIDIPIGLVETGSRACDLAARQVLMADDGRGRASSVFPAPLRSVLAATSYEEACQIREQIEGKRMSRQAWGILRKVAEVDRALRAGLQGQASVREVHPEVCFCAMAGHPMRFAKRTKEGRAERTQLVDGYFGTGTFEHLRTNHRRSLVADDDLLDAMVALWTAERVARGDLRTLPEDPPHDAFGLPMEVVF